MSAPQNVTYLDYGATTPIDPSVIEAVTESMKVHYGNPASSTHRIGWQSLHLLEECRQKIADMIGANEKQIIFNSGATEANNTILTAIAKKFSREGCHIITTEIEHKCILQRCQRLAKEGCKVSYLPVDCSGHVVIEELLNLITPETRLISIMGVNNETGVIQDLKKASEIAQKHNILLHSDCAQMVGKHPLSVQDIPLDFVSLSGHKFYGPKGVGALYARDISLLQAHPLLLGGGQEAGTRSGTVNLPGIIGFAKAAEIIMEGLEKEIISLSKMKADLVAQLQTRFPQIVLNGNPAPGKTVPGTLNFRIPGLASKELMAVMKGSLAISTGSACTSVSQEPSHVLQAMGCDRDACAESIRLSFGRFTTPEDLSFALDKISQAAKKLGIG